jgi:hypothetical protein
MKMDNIRYVISHGRRIAVGTLEDLTPLKRRQKTKPFAVVPLDLADAMAKATNTQRAFVFILLLYTAWKARGKPFAFTSARLHQAGISHYVKRRTLDALENAGLIRVERHPGRSPIVTLKDFTPLT